MKDNIKTADEILKKHIGETMSQKGVFDAMKEYAEQFIDLAAEEAKADIFYHALGEDYFVDKDSILKVKQLIK